MAEKTTKLVASNNRDWADDMATEILATTVVLLAARLRLLKVESQRDALVDATEEIRKTFAEQRTDPPITAGPAATNPVRGGAKWLP